jgi:hypothetical protein
MFYLTILFFVTIVHAKKIIASDRITLKRPFLICDKSKLHTIDTLDECNDKECEAFTNQIKLMANTDDKFWPITDDIVIYTDAGQVSRVDCEKVENITIEGITVEGEKCLDLLPIKTPSGNAAFLRKDGILLKHYEGTKCPSQDQYFHLNDLEIKLSGKRLFTVFPLMI